MFRAPLPASLPQASPPSIKWGVRIAI